MSGTSEMIAEYLVALGFSINSSSYQAFKKALDEADRSTSSLDASTKAAEKSIDSLSDRSKKASGDAKALGKEIKGTGDKAEKAGGKLDKLRHGLKTLAWGIGALATVGGTAFAFINRTMERLTGMDRMAKTMGMTAEDIHRWGFVAEQIGLSSGQMVTALQRVRDTSAVASTGFGKMAVLYRRLGVAVVSTNGEMRSSSDILQDVVQRLKTMPQSRSASFSAQLGIDPEALQALKSGDIAGAMRDYQRLSDKLKDGVNDAAQQALKFKKELGSFKSMLDFIWMSISSELIKPLSEGLESARKWFIKNAEHIKRVLTSAMKVIKVALESVFKVVGWGVQLLSSLMSLIDRLPLGIGRTIGVLSALVLAMKMFRNVSLIAFATNPITWFVAAIAGLLLLLDDLSTYMRGGKSLINWGPMISLAKQLGKTLEKLMPLFIALAGTWGVSKGVDLLEKIPNILTSISGGLRVATKAWKAMSGVVNLVTAAIAANPIAAAIMLAVTAVGLLIIYWDDLKEVVGKVCDWVSARWGEFCDWLGTKWDAAKDMLVSGWNYIKDKAGAVADWVQDKWNDLVDWFKSIPGRIWEALKSLKDVISDAVKNAIDYLLSWLPQWAKDLLGIDSGSSGHAAPEYAPPMKRGGVDLSGYLTKDDSPELEVGDREDLGSELTPNQVRTMSAKAFNFAEKAGQTIAEHAPQAMYSTQTLSNPAPLTSQNISTITSHGGAVDQSVHVDNKTEIHVTGSSDPAETARLVEQKTENMPSQMARMIGRSPTNGRPVRAFGVRR